MTDDDNIARLRVPPHSTEAEHAVLGGLLLENQAFDRVGDLLTERDFYRSEHRTIFGAIVAMIHAGKPADVITVLESLQATGKDAATGGLVYLNALAQGVPSAANIRRYAEIVRERAIMRQLIAASDEIAAAAFSPQGRSATQILGDAEAKVLAIGQGVGPASTSHGLDKLMVALMDRVSDLHDRGGGGVVGVATGFLDLDRMMSGLQPGDLIVLAARPSMGKTALALNIAEHVATKEDAPVIVFSMEMGADQLALRMAASVGRINAHALRTGRMQDEQRSRLAEAADRLGKVQMTIDEAAALSVGDLRARARRLARDFGRPVGLIVVDYLQLMSGADGNDENRATELGVITRGLKAMAKEMRCPVLALSQLNRSVESRNDKRPVMSDLRESGAIEQDADVILFIYRDEYYSKDDCREPGVAEIIIAKQRSGPTGMVRLGFARELTRFQNLAADYQPPAYLPAPRPRGKGI